MLLYYKVLNAYRIPVLQENADEFFALEKSMVQSAGALEIMQERMDDTSFAAQKKLKSALEDVSIQLGKALMNTKSLFLCREKPYTLTLHTLHTVPVSS